jgi:hypothetical protein
MAVCWPSARSYSLVSVSGFGEGRARVRSETGNPYAAGLGVELRATHEVALLFWLQEHLGVRALCLPSQIIASRVSYVLLRCVPPHGAFSGLSFGSSQFAVSTPFEVHPPAHPR